MKTRKHTTPLLSALTISMLCGSVLSAVSAHGVYQRYDTDGWRQPVICVLMQGLAHGDSSWSAPDSLYADSRSEEGNAPDAFSSQVNRTVSGSLSSERIQDTDGEGGLDAGQNEGSAENSGLDQNGGFLQQPGQTGSGNSSSGQGQKPDSKGFFPHTGSGNSASGQPGDSTASQPEGTGVQTEPKQYAFTEVSQDYFNDALFIGDSRVNGVQLYSGWDNLTYYAENGMTIYNMFQRQVARESGKALTVEEGLLQSSFGKIYLEIGINEMGTGTVDTFMKAYEEAVAHLRELQPDAILYVCGIMYVKQNKSESDPIFNNPNIQERNDRIAQLADGENIFYLDINELVTDETGNLNPAYTWDEVHLLGKYDSLWLDYFCSHGIVKED